MAMKCDMCGKGRMVGKQHKHHPGVAGGRWLKRAPKTQKIFKPNLHYARIQASILSAGLRGARRVRLCTKCLRIAKEKMKKESAPKVESQQIITSASLSS
ncbi:MAG: bL28 family ribosomal protein [bacterium]|nr:bL28 family ribosomal protein [bacterium]